ncbi:hypothetical protein L0Y40_00475 [Candidatus Wolfebacteria bacterium]|nr:hypothetical protein [Candidatus Wolfebacteria bacterium]
MVLLALTLALLIPGVASAELLVCAADLHLTRKGCYVNQDTGNIECQVWEWVVGSGDTYLNIQGISAHYLLYVTVLTGNPSYALGTFGTANLLVGRYNADPMLRPFGQDVDFLLDVCAFDPSTYGVNVSEYLGAGMESNEAYCTLATQYYSRVVGQFPNSADNADRYIDVRLSLAGWDLGTGQIRPAWRTNFESYAVGMVARVLERRIDWEHILYGGYDYTNISWAALIRVIVEMYAAGDIGAAEYAEALDMADLLLAEQEFDGSWDGDPQTTAYALLALRTDLDNPTWRLAAVRGENFLEAFAGIPQQCGWNYPPEYAEVNSEVIGALSEWQSLPFADGFETGDTSAWSSSVGVSPLREAVESIPALSVLRPAATPTF